MTAETRRAGPPPLPRPSAPRRRRAAPLIAFALPAAAAAAAVLLLARPDAGAPAPPAADPPAKLAERADMRRAAASELRPIVAVPGVAGLEPSPLEPLQGGVRPAPPARIAVPAAGIDAAVEAVGARRDGIEVPAVGRAGWFESGPRPGEEGRSIVIGHLDSERGPGLFARVPELPPGTPIRVTDRRGDTHDFRVVGGAQVRKDRFPARYVYGGSDRPVLVLITCGGPYVPGRGYRDNILLYARAA